MRSRYLIVTLLATAPAHAGQDCALFEHPNFDGASVSVAPNQSIAALASNLDNKVSSVRVARGCILVGYPDPSFKGASETWGSGAYAQLPSAWNDVISSVECNCSSIKETDP